MSGYVRAGIPDVAFSIDPWSSRDMKLGTVSGVAWPLANLAIYVPIVVPVRAVVRKLWCATSGFSPTGNVDMALYDAAGVAVISATNAATASGTAMQTFDTTDTTVGPGVYYVGLSHDGTTLISGWSVAAPFPTAMGVLTETSAYTLPATATFALRQTLAFIPAVGLLLVTTV